MQVLFHSDNYLPNEIREEVVELEKRFQEYQLSNHLKNRFDLYEDRSHDYVAQGVISCLDKLGEGNYYEPFEVLVEKNNYYFGNHKWNIVKCCIRIPYTDTQDMAFAIYPKFDVNSQQHNNKRNVIATAWLNSTNDNHQTLDTSKYCSKQDWNNIINRVVNRLS